MFNSSQNISEHKYFQGKVRKEHADSYKTTLPKENVETVYIILICKKQILIYFLKQTWSTRNLIQTLGGEMTQLIKRLSQKHKDLYTGPSALINVECNKICP